MNLGITQLSLVVRGAFVANSFVTGVLLARVLSPDDLGTWFTFVAIGAVVTAAFAQGLPLVCGREVAADPGSTASVVRTGLVRTLVPWALVAVTAVVIATISELTGAGMAFAAVAAVVVAGPQIAERLTGEVGRGLDLGWIALGGDGIYARLAFTLLLIGIAFVGAELVAVMIVYAGSFALAALVFWIGSRRAGRVGGTQTTAAVDVRRGHLDLWIQGLAVAFLAQGDLVLGALALDAQELAVYGVAWRVGSLTSLPRIALTAVASGTIFRFMADDSVDAMCEHLHRPMRRAVTASGVLLAVLVLGGPWLLDALFGSPYGRSYVPMVVIASAQFLSVIVGPLGHVLIGAGRDREEMRATLAGVAVLAVGAPFLAMTLGRTGLALAMAASLVTVAALRHHSARRLLDESSARFIWKARTPERELG